MREYQETLTKLHQLVAQIEVQLDNLKRLKGDKETHALINLLEMQLKRLRDLLPP
jgi:hypothetical protein